MDPNEILPLHAEKEATRTNDRIKGCIGIVLVVVACLCDIGSLACLQLISHLSPDFELNTLRFAVGLIFSVISLLHMQQLPKIGKGHSGWALLVALATYFYNVTKFNEYVKDLAVGAVIGIRQGFVIVLMAIATRWFLKKKHSWLDGVLTFTCILGVALVTLSAFLPTSNKEKNIFSRNSSEVDAGQLLIPQMTYPTISTFENGLQNEETNASTYKLSNEQNIHDMDNDRDSMYRITICIVLIFGCALSASTEYIIIAATSLKEVNNIFLGFWYFLFGTIFSLITSVIFEDIFIPEKAIDKILSLAHCIMASAFTFVFIVLLKLINPSILSVILSIRIPLALLTQMFLLQTVTPPVELWVLILGLSIITLSVFGISVSVVYSAKD